MKKQITVIVLGEKKYFAVPSKKNTAIIYLISWLSAVYCIDQKLDENANQLEIKRNGSIILTGHAYLNSYGFNCFVFLYSEIQNLKTSEFLKLLSADYFNDGDVLFSSVQIVERLNNWFESILFLIEKSDNFQKKLLLHPQIQMKSTLLGNSGMPIGFKRIGSNYILIEGYL